MSPSVLILQHTLQENCGLLEELFREQGWTMQVLPLFAGADFPADPAVFDLVLSLGGPMSANAVDAHPFLKRETHFLRQALKLDQPVMGICLGAQLMAKALGGRVFQGPHKEIGWYWLNQTPLGRSDPLFSVLDPYFLVFEWHGETFELPSGADCLAGNTAYPYQAFRYGTCSYALQFHLELTQPLLETWCSVWGHEIRDARPQPITAPDILRDAAIYLERLQDQARRWMIGYLNLIAGRKKPKLNTKVY